MPGTRQWSPALYGTAKLIKERGTSESLARQAIKAAKPKKEVVAPAAEAVAKKVLPVAGEKIMVRSRGKLLEVSPRELESLRKVDPKLELSEE